MRRNDTFWKYSTIIMILPIMGLLILYKTPIFFKEFESYAPFYSVLAISPLMIGFWKTMFKSGRIFKKYGSLFRNSKRGLLTSAGIFFTIGIAVALIIEYKSKMMEKVNTLDKQNELVKLEQIGFICIVLSLFFIGQMIWNKKNSI